MEDIVLHDMLIVSDSKMVLVPVVRVPVYTNPGMHC